MLRAYEFVFKISKSCQPFRSCISNIWTSSSDTAVEPKAVSDATTNQHIVSICNENNWKKRHHGHERFSNMPPNYMHTSARESLFNLLGLSCMLASITHSCKLWHNERIRGNQCLAEPSSNGIAVGAGCPCCVEAAIRKMTSFVKHATVRPLSTLLYTRSPLQLSDAQENNNTDSEISMLELSDSDSATSSLDSHSALSTSTSSSGSSNHSGSCDKEISRDSLHSLFTAMELNVKGVASVRDECVLPAHSSFSKRSSLLTHIQQNNELEAEHCWKMALQCHPNASGYPVAHYNLGLLYHKRAHRTELLDEDLLQKAEQHYRAAIRSSHGKHAATLYQLAVLLLQRAERESTDASQEAWVLMQRAADRGVKPAKQLVKQHLPQMHASGASLRSNSSFPNLLHQASSDAVLRKSKTCVYLSQLSNLSGRNVAMRHVT